MASLPMAQSLLIVIKWPNSDPSRRKGITCNKKRKENLVIKHLLGIIMELIKQNKIQNFTLRVIDGSPENNFLALEIAKFKAGRIHFARRKTSSSLTLTSHFSSTVFLKIITE